MEKNGILGLAVALTISIILVGSMLVPIINDTTTTHETLTNTGYFRASETSDETLIKWTPSADPFTITVNDEDISLASLTKIANTSYSIAFADDIILRYFYGNSSSQNIQFWGAGFKGGAASSEAGTFEFLINSTTCSFGKTGATPTSYTHTGSYFIIDPEGDFIMKDRNTPAYLKNDSVYAGGLSYVTGSVVSSIYFEGTINDYDFHPMSSYVTVSDPNTTYTQSTKYVGVYELDKVTFNTSFNDGTLTDPIVREQTYSYFLVPYQVTAELSQHLNDGQIALLNAIPIIIIIALLSMAAVMIYLKRQY